jgi:cytochrome c-type biogenesis protein
LIFAASTTDTTVFAAFAVGVVSFVSPCVLPLVPGYLSAVSGISLAEIRTGERNLSKLIVPSVIFCLSFTVMFVLLGMSATKIGGALSDHRLTLNRISGALIIALGIFFVLTPFVPALNKEWRPEALMQRAGSGGPVIAGLAFAIAWTPCAGATLSAILTAAANQDSVYHGGVLLLCYSLGLAIPFLLCAVAFDRATSAFKWMRDRYLVLTAISGLILVAMGVLLLTNEYNWLNARAQDALTALHLDFFKSL